MRNPVNSEDITIFGHNIILFPRVTPVGNNLALKREEENNTTMMSPLGLYTYTAVLHFELHNLLFS